MNPEWFGDSYDLVKRFFVGSLKSIGYSVFVEPMFTGEWKSVEKDFYRFIGADPIGGVSGSKSALLLDPDTGIGRNKTKQHVTIRCIVERLEIFDLVFTYDQSFGFNENSSEKIIEKLNLLKQSGNQGFYYDSHAKFLFASAEATTLEEVKKCLQDIGLPSKRLIEE